MRLGALFSGGKDSTSAVWEAERAGHQVSCLLTVHPASVESHLLHHPGTSHTRLQALSMGMAWRGETPQSTDRSAEDAALDSLVGWAVRCHGIGGLVHGGIRSAFQRARFEELCARHSLEPVAPLWGRGTGHLQRLIRQGFRFTVISVSAGGLDGSWLGKVLTLQDAERLDVISGTYGTAADFEGGEAETFVVDCPLFSRPVLLCGRAVWDGYTGRFEIDAASLGRRCWTASAAACGTR